MNYGDERDPRIIIICLPHYSGKISELGDKLRTSPYWSYGTLPTGSPMTWGSCRLSERSFGEGPVMTVCQKSEALNQTMTHCNEHLQVKTIGQKGILRDTL